MNYVKCPVPYSVSFLVFHLFFTSWFCFYIAQIEALSEVVEAVEGTGVDVYLDGGVRKGTDVLKALAIGAKAVFIGRPVVWGLACDVSDVFKALVSYNE